MGLYSIYGHRRCNWKLKGIINKQHTLCWFWACAAHGNDWPWAVPQTSGTLTFFDRVHPRYALGFIPPSFTITVVFNHFFWSIHSRSPVLFSTPIVYNNWVNNKLNHKNTIKSWHLFWNNIILSKLGIRKPIANLSRTPWSTCTPDWIELSYNTQLCPSHYKIIFNFYTITIIITNFMLVNVITKAKIISLSLCTD